MNRIAILIQESIEHWEENKEKFSIGRLLRIDIFSGACPLCNEFLNNEFLKIDAPAYIWEACNTCPIQEYGKSCGMDSVWSDCADEFWNWEEGKGNKFLESADRMIGMLKALHRCYI